MKQDFRNPLVVSCKKVKAVLDQPQTQLNDKTLLQHYHQSLRSTVIWLKSVRYNSAIQSVENVTKTVMRLPRFTRSKFYQDFKDSTYESNDLNLEYFEKWLANRLTDVVNPIAAIIETRENTKQNHSDKIRTISITNNNIAYSKFLEITVTLTNNNSSVGFVTITIIKFHFTQK